MTQQDQVSVGGVQLPPTAVSMAVVSPSPAVSIAMTSPPPQPLASSLEDQLRELQRTQQLQLQQLLSPSTDQGPPSSPSAEHAPSQEENVPPPTQTAPANQDVIAPAPLMNSEMLAPDANQALLDLQMLLQPPGEETAGLSEPIQPMRLDQPDSQEIPAVPPAPQRPVKPAHLQSQTIMSPSPPPPPQAGDSAVSSLPTPPATQPVPPVQGDELPSAQSEGASPSLAVSNTGGLQQLGGMAPQEAMPNMLTGPGDMLNVVGDQVPVQGGGEGVAPPPMPHSPPYKPMVPFGGEGEQEQTSLVQREEQQPLADKEQLPPIQRDQPELLSFLADMNSCVQPLPSGQPTVHVAPSPPPPGAGGDNVAPSSAIPQQGGGSIAPSAVPISPPPPGTDSTITTNSISRPIPAPVQSPPPVQSVPPTQPLDDQAHGGPPPPLPPEHTQPPAMAKPGDTTLPSPSFNLPQHQPTAGFQSSTMQHQQFTQPLLEQGAPEHSLTSSLASTNLSGGQPATQTTLYPTHKDDTSVAPPPSEITHLHEAASHPAPSGTHPTDVEEQSRAQTVAQSMIPLAASMPHPHPNLPHPPPSLAELRTGSLQPSDFSLSHGIVTSLRDLPQPPNMPNLAPLASLHAPLPTSYTQETTSHTHDDSGPSVIAKLELQLGQQKETIEKKTREVEEGRAQAADQKRQLESYKQQVALLQQQLSQLSAQQQKQEQEKVTVSGQQAVLMQLLQQQQGMFSQQQTQLESLSKVNEAHHKELQETEMKYRQAVTVEQEQKTSLQNQVLQLNQEIQRLHGQLQSQSQQQQNAQMQVYQYHTQIQERDKQLLAFRDQHKEIVQKLEQKHQEKVQQLIQQIQELQMSLKKSREQQRALQQGGLPMQIQPTALNQPAFQQPRQAQQQSVPVQQLPQQPVPQQPSSQQPQMSQGPRPPQVPGTPTPMPPHQQGIPQPMSHAQQRPPAPPLTSSTQQPLPPTSSGWPGGLGRQGSGVYHGQAQMPQQQQQIQPTQPQLPPQQMTPTSVPASTGNRPLGMIQQPTRAQPGQVNTGTPRTRITPCCVYFKYVVIIQEVQANSPHPHRRGIPLNFPELGYSLYRDKFKGPLSLQISLLAPNFQDNYHLSTLGNDCIICTEAKLIVVHTEADNFYDKN